MTRAVRKGFGAAVILGSLLVLLPNSVSAQESALQARIREVSFDSTGQTRLVVSVSGSAVTGTLDKGDFGITENGRPIDTFAVQELFDSGAKPVAVELLMDVSGSTRELLGDAKEAAASFVNQLPDPVRVGLVAFGSELEVVSAPVALASSRAEVLAAIDALQTDPPEARGTKLYDAVAAGVEDLGRQFNTQRNIVIFSDGGDVGSTTTLAQAVVAAESVDAPVTSILLFTGSGVVEESLRTLADANKAGGFVRIEETTQLDQAFANVAQAISSQYVLTYPADDAETPELDISVSVLVAGASTSDGSVVINRRAAAGPAGPRVVEDRGALVGLFANNLGMLLGIAAAFLGLLLFLFVVLQAPAGRTEERALQRRLRMYSRSERQKERNIQEGEGTGMFGSSTLGRRAVALAEKIPRSAQFDEKIQKQIDQAAWPLRSSEFILITIGGLVGGFVVGFLLFQVLYWGVLLAVVGAFLPRLVLAQRVAKRSSDFLGQLPDTLQLLSGSLQAGYGFLQALDTVAKEAAPPTSSEFSRVLAEARLGLPIEQALEDMADRVGGEDFRWVVMAINIQRQVGGNLAALLNTVADTLRERERVRRQIKVLSAEGRLSAYVLIALPFALFGYLQLVNPEYMGELTKATFGKILIVVSLVLIGVGAVWMRKIIKIDV